MGLDEQADLMAPVPERGWNELTYSLFNRVNRSDSTWADSPGFRIYASENPGARKKLMDGGLAFDEITAANRARITGLVFDRGGALKFTPPLDQETLVSDPTEALPIGIPPATRVSIKDASGPSVFEVRDGRRLQVPADSLGLRRYLHDHPEKYQQNARLASDRFLLGTQRRLTIGIQFTSDLSITEQIVDGKIANLHEASYDHLPEDYKRQVEAAYAKAATRNSEKVSDPQKRTIPPK